MTDTTTTGTTITEGGVVLVDASTKSYAYTVNIAWAATIGLLVALVLVSLWQGARVKRALAEAEARKGRKSNG
ncbi:heme exporter protein CcmD [uncultured Thioclava sp.]|uniref:Heme exporter protein D n=1 Tax=Thioclava arctica TaxID=3238301 RepID=A0ABV3TM84_9RHOB|nr:heme exporter protein CcmD [uncultured Thioclava sp.]